MNATCVRTRQSVGSQVREALDDMVERRTIRSWERVTFADGRGGYQTHGFVGNHSLFMTPGECMAWVNRHGYNVEFGKS